MLVVEYSLAYNVSFNSKLCVLSLLKIMLSYNLFSIYLYGLTIKDQNFLSRYNQEIDIISLHPVRRPLCWATLSKKFLPVLPLITKKLSTSSSSDLYCYRVTTFEIIKKYS